MKSFTDLAQSEQLTEILPIESADMIYSPLGNNYPWVWHEEVKLLERNATHCWSLAALYSILPNNENISVTLYRDGLDKWKCECDIRFKINSSIPNVFATSADNSVDACYEMIVKLHELNPIGLWRNSM